MFCNEPSAAVQVGRHGAGVETFHWDSQPPPPPLQDWVGKGAGTWWSPVGGRVPIKREVPQFPHVYVDKTDVGRNPHFKQFRNDKVCETQGRKQKIPN